MSYLGLIALLAVSMFTLRFAGLMADRITFHSGLDQALRFAPVAVLSALTATALASQGLSDPLRLLAAAGAAILVFWTRRMWVCITGGFVIYWVLRLLLG
jgi:branched-subunit amino acid transport protein